MSDEARFLLLDCLGVDSGRAENAATVSKVIREVEYFLGFYAGAVQSLDNAPRPLDYVRVFEQLRKLAGGLINADAFHNDFYSESLKAKLGEPAVARFQLEVAGLLDAAVELKKQFKGERSSGRPRGTALRTVIQGLRGLFQKYYVGPRNAREKTGAIVRRTEAEARELRFVQTALEDADIPFHNLPSLFRDSRCAVPKDWPSAGLQPAPRKEPRQKK